MSGSGEKPVGRDIARVARDRRLAEALRRNLRLRKEAGTDSKGPGASADAAAARGAGTREGALAELLSTTQAAHHAAVGDAPDGEWALWYADYLRAPLGVLLERSFGASEIASALILAERERQAEQPLPDWPLYYAKVILRECSAR